MLLTSNVSGLNSNCAVLENNTAKNIHILENRICGRRKLDIQQIRYFLIANGHNLVDDQAEADYILFFGCAFNDLTEATSREKYTALQQTGQKIIVLEGLADVFISEDVANADNHQFIGNRDYQKLESIFLRTTPLEQISRKDYTFGDYPAIQVTWGCNDNCSYCGDKLVVKELRSKPLAEITETLDYHLANGEKHIFLVGDDVGAYGIDIKLSIIDLMQAVNQIEGNFSVSLFEMNIKYLIQNYERLGEMLESGRFNNMVIAFQSGADRILELMNRGYKSEAASKLNRLLHSHKVRQRFHAIAGFPTETEAEFQETIDFIVNNKFSSGSIFCYNDRKYAPAFNLYPKVSEEEKNERLNTAARVLKEAGYNNISLLPDKLMVDDLRQ